MVGRISGGRWWDTTANCCGNAMVGDRGYRDVNVPSRTPSTLESFLPAQRQSTRWSQIAPSSASVAKQFDRILSSKKTPR
ncbi:hypothetical protein IG631_03471 [Alternaria alternata]|nr:hypothetical protein IG631_03471 [Alternaria alternata]